VPKRPVPDSNQYGANAGAQPMWGAPGNGGEARSVRQSHALLDTRQRVPLYLYEGSR
jgi:hypothetical protein